jgi:hypothetical protein
VEAPVWLCRWARSLEARALRLAAERLGAQLELSTAKQRAMRGRDAISRTRAAKRALEMSGVDELGYRGDSHHDGGGHSSNQVPDEGALAERLLADMRDAVTSLASFGMAQPPLWIFIDGVDRVADDAEFPGLGWLPARLPHSVKMVVSVTKVSLGASPVLATRLPHQLPLRALGEERQQFILDQWLLSAKRRLSNMQYRLRDIISMTRTLDWLRFTYVCENRSA